MRCYHRGKLDEEYPGTHSTIFLTSYKIKIFHSKFNKHKQKGKTQCRDRKKPIINKLSAINKCIRKTRTGII